MHPGTHRHLEQAMQEEALAFARYMMYGRRARDRGHDELADLFESFADVEVFDFFAREAQLDGFAAGDDTDNIRDAIAAEARAADDTYRVYEQQVRDAGEDETARQFSRIRAEKHRRWAQLSRTLKALERVEPHPHRILVLANESCHGSGLCDEIVYRAGRVPSEILIVAPALTRSRLHYLSSDLDRETAEATERLDTLLAELDDARVQAKGRVGDANPIIAAEDALREFPADEIVIATHPPAESTWLERGIVEKARRRFSPALVTHVVVDPARDRGVLIPGD
jgi:rubrerythrin